MGLFAAVDSGENIRFVGDVARGAACECFCPVCRSPVVAKQGAVLIWHFAHEAGQERPECLPGSLNLLRRLAVQQLRQLASIPLPPSRLAVMPDPRFPSFQDVVTWDNSAVSIQNWDTAAPSRQPAAQFVHEGYIVNLFVEVGPSGAAIASNHEDGCLVFACPEPQEGAISSEADALKFLRLHGSLRWVFCPDFKGIAEGARSRLLAEIEDHMRRKRESDAEIERKTQLRISQIISQQAESAGRPWSPTGTAPQLQNQIAHGPEPVQTISLPQWMSWKKPKTSFYAFKTDVNSFWVVMQSATHDGCYVVPVPAFEGWDESLPPLIGTADLEREVFVSVGTPINQITTWFFERKVLQSRIDSDPVQIAKFIGQA